MKKIAIPATVAVVKNIVTREPLEMEFTFETFVLGRLVTDPKFGNDMRGVLVAADIAAAFRDSEKLCPGHIQLSNDQHARLLKVLEDPTGGYDMIVMSQCVSYIQALLSPVESD